MYTLYTDKTQKQFAEQQLIELLDSTKRRRLRWCSKLGSNSSSIADCYVSHENYADTRPPPRCSINVDSKTILVQLPKEMDLSFGFEMYIAERG